MARNEAELRVALRQDEAFALLGGVTFDHKGDLYVLTPELAGAPRGRKQSWHRDGKAHIHTLLTREDGRAERLQHQRMPAPPSFTGRRRLGTAVPSLAMLDWTYRPKPDGAVRRTLIVAGRQGFFGPRWALTTWAIEARRPDLVERTLEPWEEPVGHVLIDWTQPNVLCTVRALRWVNWSSPLELEAQGLAGRPELP